MKIFQLFFTINLLFLSHYAIAYKETTHEELSEKALAASVLSVDPAVLQNLGLQAGQLFPDSKGAYSDVKGLFRTGAHFEDDTNGVKRPLNHFYNPLTGAPLTIFGFAPGSPSPDWALEDKG